MRGIKAVESQQTDTEKCHPPIDPSQPQYIVGYGSLMELASKKISEPDAGINLPVLVSGFQRSWNAHGTFGTTFLGARPSASQQMAAALYRTFPTDGKLNADARERSYCRAAVDPASITLLDGSSLEPRCQIWIYVTKPELVGAPEEGHPITQSYVDIFITGALELQEQVTEPDIDFVEQCVRTTDGWSKHWVNDRIFPRRPFMYQPRAWEIDQFLHRLLPDLFETVRIE